MHLREKAKAVTLAWSLLVCGYVFLLPVSHNIVLLPLVASLGAIAAYWFLSRRPRVNFRLLVPAMIWMLFVVYGSISAGLFGAQSWPRVMVFMFAIPLFYYLLTAVFRRSFIRPLLYLGAGSSVVAATVLISQSIVAMGALTFLKLPNGFYDFINLRIAVDPSGPLRFTSNVLPPMLWWGAMWMASIFVSSSDAYLPPKAVRVSAAVLCLTASVFSRRRAIIITLIVTPLVAALVALLLFAKNGATRTVHLKPTSALLLVGVFVASAAVVLAVQPKSYEILGASVGSIVKVATNHDITLSTPSALENPTKTDGTQVTSAPTTPVQESPPAPVQESPPATVPIPSDGTNLGVKGTYDTIRQNEARILMTSTGVRETIFGRGFGATVDRGSFYRPDLADRPWQSDLPYYLAFYWSGWVGVVFVALVVITGFGALRFAMQRAADLNGVLFIATVGAVSLVIANFSNPYMQALGHLWPLFFPFMIANAILTPLGNSEYAVDP